MMKEQRLNSTDELLWSAFRDGSEHAFDLIYEKMYPVLFNYGYHLCQDEDEIKDCIQNIFIEIWQKRTQVKEVYSLKHYFLKIMRRKVFKAQKTKKEDYFKLFAISSTEERMNFIPFLSDQQTNDQMNIKKVRHAIEELSSRKKEAILLKFYENLSYAEISEVMDLSDVKYARQLIYRSLDDLRNKISFKHDISIPDCIISMALSISFFI